MGSSKNCQTEVELQMLVVRAFHGVRMKTYRELTKGYCNAVYLIELEDGRRNILKIAPAITESLMSYEINIMLAEVSAMNIVRDKTTITLPNVYFYDDTKTLCNSEYFFMECLEGSSLYSMKESLSMKEREDIEFDIGKILRSLHNIKGGQFGLLGAKESWHDEFFSFFYHLVVGVLHDGLKKNVNIGVDYEEIRVLLLRDKTVFDEVTSPVLVHWDTWEGNWFIKDKKVTGLIDWERAMYSEGLMEERFRSHNVSKDFLRGYGIYSLTETQEFRMAWYDIYLYLTMMIEGSYREYDNDEQYQWGKKLFLPIVEKIKFRTV